MGLHVQILAADPNDRTAVYKPQVDGSPSLKPFAGVRFVTVDAEGHRVEAAAPPTIDVPMDYARGHHWIELVDPDVVTVPSGSAADPYGRPPHVFITANKLVLHMVDGDYTYRVTRNPGKYDADGNPSTACGDPTAVVHWDYLAELETEADDG